MRVTEMAAALGGRTVSVEKWGRAADTYEVVVTGQMLERLRAVQAIPVLHI